MKKINGCKFPETRDEVETWEAEMFYTALDRNVIVIARTRLEGTWKAYITACPGMNHDEEMEELWATASPVREHVARAIWGGLEDIPYAN